MINGLLLHSFFLIMIIKCAGGTVILFLLRSHNRRSDVTNWSNTHSQITGGTCEGNFFNSDYTLAGAFIPILNTPSAAIYCSAMAR